MSANKATKNANGTEQIQLLSLKPKHHNPPPKSVISNKKDSLTPDIVWSDPIPKCFLYSCIGVAIFIVILIIHNCIDNDTHTTDIPHSNHNHLSSNTDTDTPNPHILWFIFDDLGQSDFSYHGSEYSTPNIDRIAQSGIELTQHYVSPICSATRSSLLTGVHSYKMGLQGVFADYIHPSTISHIPLKYQTIADYLQNIGYRTAIYGKWHAGYAKQSYTPTQRGFHTHVGYYQYAVNPWTKFNLDSWEEGKDWWVNGQFSDDTHYAGDILLDSILDDIEGWKDGDAPLFLYISFSNPHFPVLTPDDFNAQHSGKCSHIRNSERRKYCLSVIYLDEALGEIIRKLKAQNMYSNSVIGMLSDNGPQILGLCGTPGDHIAAGSAYPLRGGKYTLFQGGVKTYAYIAGGLIQKQMRGQSSDVMMSSVDWLPTLLHFTDFYESNNALPKDMMDGMDLYPSIFESDRSSDREHLILSMEYREGKYVNTGIIYKGYKLLINNVMTFIDHNSCDLRSANPQENDAEFKSEIINSGENVPDYMLFDLFSDANERNDVLNGAGSQSEVFSDEASEVKQLIDAMMAVLDNERINKVSEIRTQFFESEDSKTHRPIDTHLIDGVHSPFQSEDEAEFPNGYNY